ncbi:hypothetical protein GCM10009754_81730 [Amycolatopsis minnesotensis]|uniref:Uncharacterized protein n=1 Tax=Amycolatopsis minnesotensis TaxID=337894 RepID=A0ABP5E699_9PSEU
MRVPRLLDQRAGDAQGALHRTGWTNPAPLTGQWQSKEAVVSVTITRTIQCRYVNDRKSSSTRRDIGGDTPCPAQVNPVFRARAGGPNR